MPNGSSSVLAECERLQAEGSFLSYPHETLTKGELAVAAYYLTRHAQEAVGLIPRSAGDVRDSWPFPRDTWAPKGPVADLALAGGLYLAEAGRLSGIRGRKGMEETHRRQAAYCGQLIDRIHLEGLLAR